MKEIDIKLQEIEELKEEIEDYPYHDARTRLDLINLAALVLDLAKIVQAIDYNKEAIAP